MLASCVYWLSNHPIIVTNSLPNFLKLQHLFLIRHCFQDLQQLLNRSDFQSFLPLCLTYSLTLLAILYNICSSQTVSIQLYTRLAILIRPSKQWFFSNFYNRSVFFHASFLHFIVSIPYLNPLFIPSICFS